jgi:hypothetical protein
MELSPEDRRNREKVNEAMRRYRERDQVINRLGPLLIAVRELLANHSAA